MPWSWAGAPAATRARTTQVAPGNRRKWSNRLNIGRPTFGFDTVSGFKADCILSMQIRTRLNRKLRVAPRKIGNSPTESNKRVGRQPKKWNDAAVMPNGRFVKRYTAQI